MVIDLIARYSYHTFHLFQLPDIVDLELDMYYVNFFVFSALFPLKCRVLFEEGILGTPVQKDAVRSMVISNYHR